jgi:IPT/TIG domain
MRSVVAAVVVALTSGFGIASADAAQITNVIPTLGRTAGGTFLTVAGSAFSAAGNAVEVGGQPCAVVVENTSTIVCIVPPGTGASRPVHVVDAGGLASPPYPFGYEPPVITAVTATSVPTAGGTLITIAGLNFGVGAAERHVHLRERFIDHFESNTDSSLVWTLPPGEGTNVPLDVTVDGQTSAPASLSYDPPAITAVTPTRVSAGGGTVVTIQGHNFGLTSVVTVGGSSCPTEEQSHDELTCVAPPNGGAPPQVVVVAGGQVSNAAPFSYQLAASKCDAAKWKAALSLTSCVGKVHAKGATKGLAPDPDALAACEEKFAASCAKAETKNTDCAQPGTCDEIAARSCCRRKGWDGTIKGRIE